MLWLLFLLIGEKTALIFFLFQMMKVKTQQFEGNKPQTTTALTFLRGNISFLIQSLS